MFNEAHQIVVTNNGVTMLKPHWMSQSYWQNYEVPRCGKLYGKSKVPYGSTPTASKLSQLKQQAQEAEANSSGACDGCTI